jgi:hypothetical protein
MRDLQTIWGYESPRDAEFRSGMRRLFACISEARIVC